MKSSNYQPLRQALKYFAPYKLSLTAMLIALCFSSMSVLGMGKGIEFLIDKGLTTGNQALLDHALLILLLITTLLAVATFTRACLINSVAEKVTAAIRIDVYSHIIKVSPAYFELSKTSDIISRLSTDTTVLNNIIGSVTSASLRNIIMLFGGTFMLITTSPKLTLYVSVIVPLVLIPIVILGKKVRILSRSTQEALSGISASVEESINGIKTVQSFAREDFEISFFTTKVQIAKDKAISWIRMRGLLAAIVIFVVLSSIVIVLWIGGGDVINGKMTPGALSSFIFYAIMVASSISGLSDVVGDLQRAAGAAERLFELLGVRSTIVDPITPRNVPEACDVKIDNISFCYPARPEIKALENFSLSINQGEKIALVGPSGSGKTTIFQLLLRFYDPQQGNISLGDTNIKDLALQPLRNQFALVAQEPVIFSASAKDNIRYGNLNATDLEIREAAKAAEILEFIDELPQGMNTFLGEKGVRISGGQRQRIAIARAILRDPKILLLDEATSNLDTQNEKLVQSAIQRLMIGRTVIIIAHRLSTITDCDRIVVIDGGKIEAIGTHIDLLSTSQTYAKLNQLQEYT